MESISDNTQLEFNPFRIFDRSVARKFLIRRDERYKYTPEQLDEMVPCSLNIFVFDSETWFLARDVCSFLGINPGDSSKALKSIEPHYVRQETVNCKTQTCAGRQAAQVSQRRLVSFVNEAGIYALIQKSKTSYAIEFKKWLYEEVLPSIRTNGTYELPSEVDEERRIIEDAHEFEEFAAKLMTPEEQAESLNRLTRIIEEKDKVILEKEIKIEQKESEIKQKDIALESKNSDMKNLMDFLLDMRNETRRSQEENRSMREEFRRNQVENKCTLESLQSNVKKLQTTISILVKDKIARPVDEGKFSLFIIYDTHEDNVENKRYPYCIVRCQKQHLKTNNKRVVDKYPHATRTLVLENPSADSLLQVVKEQVKERELDVKFINTSFYCTTDECTIRDVIDLVREIDRERTNANMPS